MNFQLKIESQRHGVVYATVPARFRDEIYRHTWRVCLQPSRATGRQFVVMTNLPRNDGRQRSMYLHRFIWGLSGRGAALQIDHIDGNPLNNAESNLRAATKAENACNQRLRRDNSTGFIGVVWNKSSRKWAAKISVGGRRKHLGYFPSATDAARARDAAARLYHGPFAVLNGAQP